MKSALPRYRFEMYVGEYLGGVVSASLWSGPVSVLTASATSSTDIDGTPGITVKGAGVDDFLAAVYEGPLTEERRLLVSLPVIARSWTERH